MQLINFILGAAASPWNTVDWLGQHFEKGESPAEIFSHWPTNYTGGVEPVRCHSHNDYWRDVPLFSALQAGCIGVEADVWLFGDEFYVGHTPSSLASHLTLKTLYIQPLLDILDSRNPPNSSQSGEPNGIFDTDPSQTVVLLVDVKARGRDAWYVLQDQLSPLREKGYLTHFNGTNVIERPITVVATGRTPFDLVVTNSTYRDVFFDAPLRRLRVVVAQDAEVSRHDSSDLDIEVDMHAYLSEWTGKGEGSLDGQDLDTIPHQGGLQMIQFDSTNSYYASVSFKKAIGFPFGFFVSKKQRSLIREQVRQAHQHGLKARYWATPGWPRFLRDHIWTVLMEEGVDVLNVDDLRSATRKFGIWRTRRST